MIKKNYRPDIDGLRAIAVILVVLFHAFPKLLPGGFIGVDIFFVISGFLITGILFDDITNNRLDIINFYQRRIVRLLPALILIFIAVFAAGNIYFFAHEFDQLGRHLYAGSIFASNILLIMESGYFDNESITKPLLHLWSLAVEEQYYIFWPLFLFFVSKLKKLEKSIHLISAPVLISFLISLYLTKHNPTYAFYLPFSRFWEIGVGAILAVVYRSHPGLNKKIDDSRLKLPISVAGLILILFSAVQFNSKVLYPGWRAILPCVGTVFLILGKSSWLNNKVLSFSWLVGIGLISYPLYLWHWPMISFSNILYPTGIPTPYMLLLIGGSILLAFLTYFYIERGAKRLFITRKKIIVIPLITSMIAFALIGKSIREKWLFHKVDPPEIADALEAIGETRSFPGALFKEEIKTDSIEVYSLGNGKEVTIFFGDSNMESYEPKVSHLFEKGLLKDKKIIFITRLSCPPIFGVQDIGGFHCNQFLRQTQEYIEKIKSKDKIHSVVLAAQWTGYFEGANQLYYVNDRNINERVPQLSKALYQTLQYFKEKSDKVFMILNIPVNSIMHPRMLIKRGVFDYPKINPKVLSQQERLIDTFPERFQGTEAVLRGVAKKVGNINVIDPIDMLKKNGRSIVKDSNGRLIYRDCCHIRTSFSRNSANFLDQILL